MDDGYEEVITEPDGSMAAVSALDDLDEIIERVAEDSD